MEQKLQYIVDKIGELNIQINEKQAEQFILLHRFSFTLPAAG